MKGPRASCQAISLLQFAVTLEIVLVFVPSMSLIWFGNLMCSRMPLLFGLLSKDCIFSLNPSCSQLIAVDSEFQLFTRAWCVAEIHQAQMMHMPMRSLENSVGQCV